MTPEPPQHSRTDRTLLTTIGRILFALAIAGIGIETIVVAHAAAHPFGPGYSALPVIPWLPAHPSLACLFGVLWIACAAGLLFVQTLRPAAASLTALLFLAALLIQVPRYAVSLGNISLRTTVFEVVSLACFAWLLQGALATPLLLTRICRYLLALALVAFGVDHFLALPFIAALLPRWIPFHAFWVAFFGIAMIAAGVSLAFRIAEQWGAVLLGAMFALWVLTLHLPRVLGLYGIPGATHNPAEWSSFLIALAFWGGAWSLTHGAPTVHSPRT